MQGMARVGRFLLRTPLITAVITATLVLGGGIYVFASSGTPGSAAGEIFLEPADALGAEPFLNQLRTPVPTIVLARQLLPDERKNGTASLSGGTIGLYGGTLNNNLCDRDELTEFLVNNPTHGRAWASVQGITIEQIPTYIANLTPMQLRLDTRVTNHGYQDGNPTPHQAVLQAGTAVLVDRTGVPKARCACGNPLLAPQPVTNTYNGTPWAGFDNQQLLRITPHDTDLTTFTLHDATTNTLFNRPTGTNGDQDKPLTQPAPKPATATTSSTTAKPAPPITTTTNGITSPTPTSSTSTSATSTSSTSSTSRPLATTPTLPPSTEQGLGVPGPTVIPPTTDPPTTEPPATTPPTVPPTSSTSTSTTTTTTTAPKVTVPDFRRSSFEEAQATAKGSGLVVAAGRTSQSSSLGCGESLVTAQGTKPGTLVARGSTVTVDYVIGLCLR